jgi:glyceraldehyde 3-phosphate dehydrogenase
MTKIAINGFGRIGRCIARILFARGGGDLELVGINDLTDARTLAHLLKFDSVHGAFEGDVKAEDGALVIAGRKVPISAERDPAKLPWKALGAEVVLECTGLFTSKEKASAHLQAGAKRVIISAPGGSDVDGTFCVGINLDGYDPAKHVVVSNASCTTNCLAPVAKVLHQRFGIVKGHMVTVH